MNPEGGESFADAANPDGAHHDGAVPSGSAGWPAGVPSNDVVAAMANEMLRVGYERPSSVPGMPVLDGQPTAPVALPTMPTDGPFLSQDVSSPAWALATTATPMAGPVVDRALLNRLRLGLDLSPVAFAAPRAKAGAPGAPAGVGHDAFRIRDDFPSLHQRVHGKRLVWLDNAATTQKPQAVIDAVSSFYEHDNSNVHRGAHALAARATDAYEGAREKVRAFLGASSSSEIVFVRGTTEAINLVAQAYGRANVARGDEVIVTELEHHSNIVPWQLLCAEKEATLRVVPINDRGEVLVEEYARLLGPRTRIVALSHVSNALGSIVPVELMTAMAKGVGARVLVDGAQAVPHLPVDVQRIGCDFYAMSGHKLYAPSGVGVLYGRREVLEAMPPWQGGGQMIKTVAFDEMPTWNELPYKFEAGTGILAGAVGLGAAIDYVLALGLPGIAAHEHALLERGTAALSSIRGVTLVGTSPIKAGVLSFVLDGMAVEEVGRILDHAGVAVRAGHHCAQPALRHFGLTATVRPSLGLYNTHEDIDVLASAVHKAARARR